jgi:hypothetical protein
MKRTIIATVGALALLAFPSIGLAQSEHHATNSKKADFHLSQPVTIGNQTATTSFSASK